MLKLLTFGLQNTKRASTFGWKSTPCGELRYQFHTAYYVYGVMNFSPLYTTNFLQEFLNKISTVQCSGRFYDATEENAVLMGRYYRYQVSK